MGATVGGIGAAGAMVGAIVAVAGATAVAGADTLVGGTTEVGVMIGMGDGAAAAWQATTSPHKTRNRNFILLMLLLAGRDGVVSRQYR